MYILYDYTLGGRDTTGSKDIDLTTYSGYDLSNCKIVCTVSSLATAGTNKVNTLLYKDINVVHTQTCITGNSTDIFYKTIPSPSI